MGGTLAWRAPETMDRTQPPRPAADVFSFGRLLFLIGTQTDPVLAGDSSVFGQTMQTGVVPELNWKPMPLSESFKPVHDQCVNADPQRRPTMEHAHGLLGLVEAPPGPSAEDQTFSQML